jgi:hypothetical protein
MKYGNAFVRKKYAKTFIDFVDWAGSKYQNGPARESKYIKYFQYLRNEKQYKSSTLWTLYSMLNKHSRKIFSISSSYSCFHMF